MSHLPYTTVGCAAPVRDDEVVDLDIYGKPKSKRSFLNADKECREKLNIPIITKRQLEAIDVPLKTVNEYDYKLGSTNCKSYNIINVGENKVIFSSDEQLFWDSKRKNTTAYQVNLDQQSNITNIEVNVSSVPLMQECEFCHKSFMKRIHFLYKCPKHFGRYRHCPKCNELLRDIKTSSFEYHHCVESVEAAFAARQEKRKIRGRYQLKCPTCDFKCRYTPDLVNHRCEGFAYTCPLCKKGYNIKGVYNTHLSRCNKRMEGLTKCQNRIFPIEKKINI